MLKKQRELSISHIYTEGKYDVDLLNIAWKKLFPGEKKSFVIKASDPLGEDNSTGGSGGATTLRKLLETTQHDSRNTVIGIFDRDMAGIKEYNKLPRYFEESPNGIKHSKNNKAFAILLPVPKYRKNHAKYNNLVLEYYFRDNVLNKLKFSYPAIKVNNVIINGISRKYPATRIIKDASKKYLTETLAPKLNQKEFFSFKLIFNSVKRIINNQKSVVSE